MMIGVGGGRVPLSGGCGGGDAERASGRTAHGSTSSPVICTAILNNKKKQIDIQCIPILTKVTLIFPPPLLK